MSVIAFVLALQACQVDDRSLSVAMGSTGGSAGGRTAGSDTASSASDGAAGPVSGSDGETTGAGHSSLSMTPPTYQFPQAQQGMMGASQAFVVQNDGQARSGALAGATLDGAERADFVIAADGCQGKTLAMSDSCAVTVRFAPGSTGPKIATLDVTGAPGESATAQLSGTAVANASLSIDPPSADFHTVTVSTAGSVAFRVANLGGVATAPPVSQLTGANADQFTILDNGCTATIPAGAFCSVTVQFKPTSAGAKTAALFVSAGAGSSASAPLSGTAVPLGAIRMDPPTNDFGSLLRGTTSVPTRITVRNMSNVTTGTLSTSIVGATDFSANDGCRGTFLAPNGMCLIDVTFTPAMAGPKNATLQATADPGGTTSASLTGQGLAPAALGVSAVAAFPSTLVGSTSVSQGLTVTNNGDVPAGSAVPLAIAIAGANASDFVITSNTCAATLAARYSCFMGIAFKPTGGGTRSATLTASADPGGSPMASLSGTSPGLPAKLTGAADSHDFGGVEVGSSPGGFTWSVSNSGDVASGALAVANSDAADFAITNNCGTAALGAGRSCTIVVTPRATAGPHTGTISVSASPGGTASLLVSASGLYRVTVTTTGTGTVTSVPPGISCPPTCSAPLPPAATLQARTTNGSGFFFSSWSGGGCTGPTQDCALSLNGPVSVGATFSRMTANLIFVTSNPVALNVRSPAAFDGPCNAAATAAGINNTAGNGYIAVVSDRTTPFRTRLGTTARGWVRIDGKPFADSSDSLFTNSQVFNAIRYFETGEVAPPFEPLASGTGRDGMVCMENGLDDCTGWTGTGIGVGGYASGGPTSWVSAAILADCAGSSRIVCMGKTSTVPVSNIVTQGRRIWAAFLTPGSGMSPDAVCQADAPAGVTAAAFIAHPGRAGSAVLNNAMSYVRLDGTFVGTGADLAAGRVASGIWQFSTMYSFRYGAWVGQTDPATPGTAAGTCNDWTSTTGDALLGYVPTEAANWWNGGGTNSCSFSNAIYCVQTAP